MAPLVDLSGINIEDDKLFSIKWVDEFHKKPLCEENLDEEDLINLVNPPLIKSHKESRQVKSIVKGSKLS